MEAKFGTSVGKLEWLQNEDLWMLTGLDGQNLGQFNGVVASDKNVVSPQFTSVTGRPPPLGMVSYTSPPVGMLPLYVDVFVFCSLFLSTVFSAGNIA